MDFSILPSAEERHGRYLLKILPAVFLPNLLSNCQLHYDGMHGTTTSKAPSSVHGEPGSLVILVVRRYSKPIGIQSILGIQSKIVTQQLKSCIYKFYGCFNPKAPAKRSQHANATCRNIVGRNMLRAFDHHVATCCDVLGVVGSNLTSFNNEPTTRNMLQHVATGWPNARNMLCPTMLGYVALIVAIVWPGL